MIFKSNQVKQMQQLVKEQTLSFGVFECVNLLAMYEELKAKGVEFCIEPYQNNELMEYEAAFFDDSGNWFRLTERKRNRKKNSSQRIRKNSMIYTQKLENYARQANELSFISGKPEICQCITNQLRNH